MLSLGVLVTALLLGVRHAFDADHIAAIDNVTRQFAAKRRPSGAVGFWFAVGHSTIVFAMTAATIAGAKFAKPLLADDSPGQHALGLFGSVVSISFLLIVGLMNLRIVAISIKGAEKPAPGWLMRKTELVTRPWHMFFVGLLFGLGFDTATEIALLVLAATTALSGVSLWFGLVVPIAFAVGMSFFDALDGWLMGLAYRKALADGQRERWYNLVITGLSVAVALGVGVVELVSLVMGRDLVDLEYVGYGVAAVFLVLWALWFSSVLIRGGKRSVEKA